MYKYTFKFRNVTYACVGEDDDACAFNLMQFQHCLDKGDWVTLNNRIINQLDEYVIVVEGTRVELPTSKTKKKKDTTPKPKKDKPIKTKKVAVEKNNGFW